MKNCFHKLLPDQQNQLSPENIAPSTLLFASSLSSKLPPIGSFLSHLTLTSWSVKSLCLVSKLLLSWGKHCSSVLNWLLLMQADVVLFFKRQETPTSLKIHEQKRVATLVWHSWIFASTTITTCHSCRHKKNYNIIENWKQFVDLQFRVFQKKMQNSNF